MAIQMWQKVRLGDLVTIKHGWAFKSKFFEEYSSNKPIVVNIGNFQYTGGFRFDTTTLKAYAGDYPEEYILKPGDILLVMTCQTAGGEILGIPGRIPDDSRTYLHNQRMGKAIITNPNAIDKDFLYWLFLSPAFNRELFLSASGTKILHTAPSRIEAFKFMLPPLDKQKKIAHILGTLDDKIELNQQMNQTLEGIARALFKSWFIDFDPVRAKLDGRQPYGMDAETAALFPDSFEDSPLGKIPKGWKVKMLNEVTTKIGSGATPRGGSQVYIDKGISLIRSQNVYDYEFRWDGLAFMTEDTATQLKNVVVEPDDILLNITGDSILRTCVVDPSVLPARVNQHVAIIRAKKGIPCRYLHLHLVNPQMKNILLGFDTGATRKAVTKGQLESVKILIPSHEVLHTFDNLTKPMFQNIQTNLVESRALASIRDALLLKLLSGEIRVKEADQALEEVT